MNSFEIKIYIYTYISLDRNTQLHFMLLFVIIASHISLLVRVNRFTTTTTTFTVFHIYTFQIDGYSRRDIREHTHTLKRRSLDIPYIRIMHFCILYLFLTCSYFHHIRAEARKIEICNASRNEMAFSLTMIARRRLLLLFLLYYIFIPFFLSRNTHKETHTHTDETSFFFPRNRGIIIKKRDTVL